MAARRQGETEMPIRHLVMWNVGGGRGHAEHRANCVRIKHAFEGLAGRIPGLLKIEVGLDVSAVDYACDVVLLSEFDNEASLAAYGHHPAHLAVREQLGDLRIARHQVDYFFT
jgi:hypothetical protein